MKKKVTDQRRHGFSLIELMVVIAIVAIPILAVGILAASGKKSFQQTYNSIHKPIREDAMAAMTAFGTIARKSNRSNYQVYKISNGAYTVAVPPYKQDVASGQAVEFRYWEQPFDPANPGVNTLDVTNTGTNYALFYLDDRELKVDYGTVVKGVGGIQDGVRITSHRTSTRVLSGHVDLTAGTDLFSHTISGGAGMGSVRMNIVLTDEDGESVEIKTSALLRMNWPR